MKAQRKVALLTVVLASLLGMAGTVRAQTATGQITGAVKDTSGAVIPDVKVTATNQGTSIARETTTTSSGDYSFPLLPVGVYSVAAEKQGFQIVKRSNIQLNVADVIRVDLDMTLGQVTQTVEVTAAAVTLDTESSAVTQLIGQRQVDQLPLNSRNFTAFLLLGAGAVDTHDGEQTAMRQDKGGSYSINGARPTGLNFTLDGIINTDVALNTPAVIVSQDAIQEFKEQTATYSAQYGYSSNQVDIISKSGTNALHGSVFEFLRNDALDARNTFAPSVPELRQNQFGFVAGGPVYIPKVYDGRNKTFWMANYEGWRIRRGNINQGLVPDPAQLGGDFSDAAATLPAFGTAACTTQLTSNLPCMPVDPNTGLPFTGNKIDPSRFSRLTKETLSLNMIPAPNCDPAVCNGNNYKALVTLPTTMNQQTYKVDQDLGRYGRVFGRMTFAHYDTETLGTLTIPQGNNTFVETERSWMVSHTLNLGARNVNNFRFGRLGATANQCGVPVPQSVVDALGITGVFPNLPDCARSYPGSLGIGNYTGVGGPVNDTTLSYIPTWQFADDFSMIRGKHTFTMGADYRRWVQNRNLAADFLGTPTYRNDQILTNGTGCPTVYCGTGNAVADFLLGYYYNTGIYQPAPFSKPGIAGNLNQYHFQYFAPYVQDDWKVTPRLTLNLGLRWDFRTVPFEESNKMGWLDGSNSKGGLCIADQTLVTKGVAPAGNGFYRYCGRRNPADASKTPFAPRFGFAWRPFGGEKTVVRGGYGIFFDSAEGREIDDSGDIYPYEVRSTLTPSTQPVASAPKLTDQLYPAFTTIAPVSPDKVTFIAVIISERPRNPYVQQWSLSVQRELAPNTTLEVNYIGNKGTHLLTRNDIAQAVAPSDPDFCSQQIPPNATKLPNLQGDCPVSARRPYANFTGVYINSEWRGISNYNAANVKLERRTSSLTMQAVYTWSKSLDNKSAAAGIGNAAIGWNGFMDNHRPQLDYGRSDFDVGQRFVTNFIYALPVGRGQHYMSNANKAADALLGGWRVGGIYTAQLGFPMSVYGQDPFGLNDVIFGSGNRANLTGSPVGPKTVNEWFNTANFSQSAPAHYGTSGRNIVRGPGINTWDLNLAKTFLFTETLRLEFRAEAFNFINHPQYAFPDSTITDATYGKITSTRLENRQVQFGLKFIF
jgi:hypothetical protein